MRLSPAHILPHVHSSGDQVAGIIATPGTGNIQPRIDGAKPIFKTAGDRLRGGRDLGHRRLARVQQDSAWYAGHKDVKFMMTVDSGDSNAAAQFIVTNQLKGKVGASGLGHRHPGDGRHPSGSLLQTSTSRPTCRASTTLCSCSSSTSPVD